MASSIFCRWVNMVGQCSSMCSAVWRPVVHWQFGESFNLHLNMWSARLLCPVMSLTLADWAFLGTEYFSFCRDTRGQHLWTRRPSFSRFHLRCQTLHVYFFASRLMSGMVRLSSESMSSAASSAASFAETSASSLGSRPVCPATQCRVRSQPFAISSDVKELILVTSFW